MKILIMRVTPNQVNLSTYNLQEIGLAKALVRKGHQCDVAYFSSKGADRIQQIEFDAGKSINILWLHGFGMFYEGIYPSLRKYVNNYNIIQIGGYIGITSLWLNTHVQSKVINYHGSYYYPENKGDIIKAKIWDHLLLPFSNKKKMIVATKSILATEYIKTKGIAHVTTIGVGLDIDNLLNIEGNSYENEFINKLSRKKKKKKYLLYVGVMEPRRNIIFLLEIFQKVSANIKNCELILIGNGKLEYVQKCFEHMEKLGIKDKVIYQDNLEQKHMKAVYELSDVFILPTRYEIFGMVILEAMYFKLPVITTYNGGSSTLINNENGIVISELDSVLWSKKICELLSNEQLCRFIGENAHHIVSKEYMWDVLAEKFLKLYYLRLNYK